MRILSIDAQNLYMASKQWATPLDYEALFAYFTKEKWFDRIDLYMWYIHTMKDFYHILRTIWYTLQFKTIYINSVWETKANVDIDIAIQSLTDHRDGLITSRSLLSWDSDYISLINYFKKHWLFLNLYVPAVKFCSRQLRQSAGVHFIDLEALYIQVILSKKKTLSSDTEST
jgi:uncharacterized LabA/DUF88 family protein